LGVPQEKIDVIPNGVDLNGNNYNDNNTTDEVAFEGRRVVLFVGPLIRRKGPHVLIRAISSVVAEHPDALFAFVGGGSFKEEAEKLSRELHVEKHTLFLGYVPEAKLNHLYRRSDIFVLPSFSEALSYSILDAFAFSKPVISTQIPCIKDYLSQAALLVPPGDPHSLAKAVIHLLSNEESAIALGASGRRLVETCFRWDLVVDRVLHTYDEALDS
jgi:1,4-alpha-glucan branching enzyme